MYKYCFLFFALIFQFHLNAQTFPSEGKKLHYRIVGFKFITDKPTGKFHLEVAKGTYNSLDSFKKNVILNLSCTTNKVVGELPWFGTDYTWRVVTGSKSENKNDSLHHFSTGSIPIVDSNNCRLKVKVPASKHKDAYVFSDMSKVLYDMNGKPVWYLPNVLGIIGGNAVVRDMKRSTAGTITLLANDRPYEIDYNGNLIWRGPREGYVSGDSVEHFHHEFTRLDNGHYMVLGNELLPFEAGNINSNMDTLVPTAIDGNGQPANNLPNNALPEGMTPGDKRKGNRNMHPVKISYGTILEYDKFGKLLWYWKSSEYYGQVDFHNCKTGKKLFDIHENSFCFDQKKQKVYVGFKNISQIVKLSYPDAAIENIFGSLYYPGEPCSDSALFWEQHACRIAKNGDLLVFNNNMRNLNEPPRIEMMEEVQGAKFYLKKKWEYQYPIDLRGLQRLPLTNGGNVEELEDESIFVSMCTPYSNMYIVNKDKELIWDAELEKYNDVDKKWIPFSMYRGSIIDGKKGLEDMIWKSAPLRN